jgi:hypothetical protein
MGLIAGSCASFLFASTLSSLTPLSPHTRQKPKEISSVVATIQENKNETENIEEKENKNETEIVAILHCSFPDVHVWLSGEIPRLPHGINCR